MNFKGDQVQYSRADAETWRWLEHTEIKHGDFERSIRFFGKMGEVWLCIRKSNTGGKAAYASKQAAMWQQLEHESKIGYAKVGVKSLRCREGSDDTLAQRVVEFRKKQLKGLVSALTRIGFLD